MLITNKRCKLLKEKLSSKTQLCIGSYKLKVTDLEFIELPRSTNTKINCNKIKEISNEIVINKQKLASLNKLNFKESLKIISQKFANLFIYWGKEIGYLDFINSGATASIKNKYIKPEIKKSNDDSYFTATALRHPIVEVINKDFNYVPHDIGLGGLNDIDGILICLILLLLGSLLAKEVRIFISYPNLLPSILSLSFGYLVSI
jgi:DNA mismatch repair ATPase MutS